MQESYAQLWRALRLYSSALPTTLAQQFIRSRFRDLRRKRLWSWRIGQGQFLTDLVYNTGQVSAVRGSSVITGIATAWDGTIVGKQFRVGNVAPLYTVVEWDSPTQLIISDVYGGPTASPVNYQILNAYITPTPADFQDFISVRDTLMNWQLKLHVPQEYVDAVDAQRANSGTPYCMADLAYNQTQIAAGSIGTCTQVLGTGATPFSTGLYTGFTKSLYVLTITTGGASGTAQFTWRKDNGASSTALSTSPAPTVIDAGVNVQFPLGVYNVGDIFVIAVSPGYTSAMPMFELWPYQMSQRVYPYLYDRRFPDTDDPNWALPRYIDGDMLIKGALADVCRWKGTADVQNPMYSLDVAMSYEKEFQAKVGEMEREDDEVYLDSVRWQLRMPYPDVFAYGADWAQKHDVM